VTKLESQTSNDSQNFPTQRTGPGLGSWPMLLAVLGLAAFFFVWGLLKSLDPFSQLTSFLDETFGPGQWRLESYFHDRQNKVLILSNLDFSAGGIMGLPAEIAAGRLEIKLPLTFNGRLAKVIIRNLKTKPNPSGQIIAVGSAEFENLEFKPQGRSWYFSASAANFSSLTWNAKTSKPFVSSSSEDHEVAALSLDQDLNGPAPKIAAADHSPEALKAPEETKIELRQLTLAEGLKFSSGQISAPKTKVSSLTWESTAQGFVSSLTLGSLSADARNSVVEKAEVFDLKISLAPFSKEGRPAQPIPLAPLAAAGSAPTQALNSDEFRLSFGSISLTGLDWGPMGQSLWSPNNLTRLNNALAHFSLADLSAGLILDRPFELSSAQLRKAELLWPGVAALKLEKADLSELSRHKAALRAENVSLTPGRPSVPDRNNASSASGGASFSPPAAIALSDLLADYGQIKGVFEFTSVFQPQTDSYQLTVDQLDLTDLASVALSLEIANLTPAAVDCLRRLISGDPAGVLDEPALHSTGLSRLNLDFRDQGFIGRFVDRWGTDSAPDQASAANYLADAIELGLTIRYDPWLSDAKGLANIIRTILTGNQTLVLRMQASPPLSPSRLKGDEKIPDLLNSLNISVTVKDHNPTQIRFRSPDFDRDYTGDDSGLYPKK
jgi:hypothetical protein